MVRQWGNPPTSDQAKEMTVTLPITARVYAIMLTDTTSSSFNAIDTVMCWERDNLGKMISSFKMKATFPPNTFNWLFIGSTN